MSTGNVRAVTSTCERCHSKLQAIAELLILSCDARPVRTETITSRTTSSQVKDKIFATLKAVKILMKSIINNVHMLTAKTTEICDGLQELSSLVVMLMELCSHTAYLHGIAFKDCCQAIPGLVDKYSICSAGLEIKLSCNRLKRVRIEELSPQLIIDLCSNISKYISIITDICKSAGEKVRDEGTQDQFKLCVKSVTCAAGCLIASIKSYKSHANSRHHSRVLVFCEPVLASSQALVSFATEDDFIGDEATLTPEARDAQKSILGACMSIVSACIQMCKTVRELAYDMITATHREKLRMCIEAVERSSTQLVEILHRQKIGEKVTPNAVPGRLAALFHQRNFDDRSPESPPVERFTEILKAESDSVMNAEHERNERCAKSRDINDEKTESGNTQGEDSGHSKEISADQDSPSTSEHSSCSVASR